jgi:hypothetical protein
VHAYGPPISANYYHPPKFWFTPPTGPGNLFVAFTKDNCDSTLSGRSLSQVESVRAVLSLCSIAPILSPRGGPESNQSTAQYSTCRSSAAS